MLKSSLGTWRLALILFFSFLTSVVGNAQSVFLNEPGAFYFYDDRFATVRFYIFDAASYDTLVVSVAKARGGTLGKIKQIDYRFGYREYLYGDESWWGHRVAFFPNAVGLPAKITSDSGYNFDESLLPIKGQQILFQWRRDYLSVAIKSSLKAKRKAAATRSFPKGLQALTDSSYLQGATIREAAESGALAQWLAHIVRGVGTWGRVAAETLLYGDTPAGQSMGIVMDPKWVGGLPLFEYCEWIGDIGWSPTDPSPSIRFGAQASSILNIEHHMFFAGTGTYSYKGDFHNIDYFEPWPAARDYLRIFWDDLRESVKKKLGIKDEPVAKDEFHPGYLQLRWERNNDTHISATEGEKLWCVVERLGGAYGTVQGSISVRVDSSSSFAQAQEGKDFVFKTKNFAFGANKFAPLRFPVVIKTDRIDDPNEYFTLELRSSISEGDVAGITARIGNTRVVSYQGDIPPQVVTIQDSQGNAVSDYVRGTLLLSPGSSPDTFTVQIVWRLDSYFTGHSGTYQGDGEIPNLADGAIISAYDSKSRAGFSLVRVGDHYEGNVSLKTYWETGYQQTGPSGAVETTHQVILQSIQ